MDCLKLLAFAWLGIFLLSCQSGLGNFDQESALPQFKGDEYIVVLEADNNNRKSLTISEKSNMVALTSDIQILDSGLDETPYLHIRSTGNFDPDQLARQAGVKAVFPNSKHNLLTKESLPLVGQPIAFQRNLTGKGKSVVVLDSGVDYRYRDFGICRNAGDPDCRVIYTYEASPDDNRLDAPELHGTNIAGIVAAMAPDAGIISIDVSIRDYENDKEIITMDDALAGLNWVSRNVERYNIAAVNMSFGEFSSTTLCTNSPYTEIFEQLTSQGVALIAATGNDFNKRGINSPACHPLAISVGSTTDQRFDSASANCRGRELQRDQASCFSNSAGTVDLLAPGQSIFAGGTTKQGTSMAAPHVAAAFALLSDTFPDINTRLDRFKNTGRPITDTNGLTIPRMDIGAALNEPPQTNIDELLIDYTAGGIVDILANDTDDGPRSQLQVVDLDVPPGLSAYVSRFSKTVYIFPNEDLRQAVSFIKYTIEDQYGQRATGEIRVRVKNGPLLRRVDTGKRVSKFELTRFQDKDYFFSRHGKGINATLDMQQIAPNGKLLGKATPIRGGGIYEGEDFDVIGTPVSILLLTRNVLIRIYPDGSQSVHAYGSLQDRFTNYDLACGGVQCFGLLALDRLPTKYNGVRINAQRQPPGASLDKIVELSERYENLEHPAKIIAVDRWNFLLFSRTKSEIRSREFSLSGFPINRPGKQAEISDQLGIGDMAIARPVEGLYAIAWSEGLTSNRKKVKFQPGFYQGSSIAPEIEITPEETGWVGDVELVALGKENYRVFWTELHADFTVLMSAGISTNVTPNLVEKRIEYLSSNTDAHRPFGIRAISGPNKSYTISWTDHTQKAYIQRRLN